MGNEKIEGGMLNEEVRLGQSAGLHKVFCRGFLQRFSANPVYNVELSSASGFILFFFFFLFFFFLQENGVWSGPNVHIEQKQELTLLSEFSNWYILGKTHTHTHSADLPPPLQSPTNGSYTIIYSFTWFMMIFVTPPHLNLCRRCIRLDCTAGEKKDIHVTNNHKMYAFVLSTNGKQDIRISPKEWHWLHQTFPLLN